MSNDKVFAIATIGLVAAVLSVITASVVAGVASVPGPLVFAEHLFFTVGFRTAYKSLDGPGWPFWPARAEEADQVEVAAEGHAAGATS
ncbi:MAG: hypothetical protein ACQGVK_02005 [Myxococcota bacterium]